MHLSVRDAQISERGSNTGDHRRRTADEEVARVSVFGQQSLEQRAVDVAALASPTLVGCREHEHQLEVEHSA